MDGMIFGLMHKGIRQSKFTVVFRVDSYWMMTVPMDELTAPMTNPGRVAVSYASLITVILAAMGRMTGKGLIVLAPIRKCETKRRAFACAVRLDPDFSTMRLDDALDERQPDARPFAGGVQFFEQTKDSV